MYSNEFHFKEVTRTYLLQRKKNLTTIGVCDGDYSSHSLPGREPMPIAFHTNNGVVYESNSDQGKPTNQPGNVGDTIRCSLRCSQMFSEGAVQHCKMEVLFFRNGAQVSSVLSYSRTPGRFFLV